MSKHCIVILTSYEFESLQLTLKALDHTVVEEDVPIFIILNGYPNFKGSMVEKLCRRWASERKNRHVIRPLSSGKEPFFAIQEVINSDLLKDIDYICKIDDDLIPLKAGWLSSLEKLYKSSTQEHKEIGFVTGLINNNCWGFNELLSIYNKWDEYRKFMNHPSLAGLKQEKIVPAGGMDININGTIWQYPALAAWLHEWTSFNLPQYIAKTSDLGVKEVDLNTHYSIGCMYSHKKLWTDLKPTDTNFDELLIHLYCKNNQLRKFAVLNEPFLHLYYFKQRMANSYLLKDFAANLGTHFNDNSFEQIQYHTVEDRLIDIEEKFLVMKNIDLKFSRIEQVLSKLKKFIPFKI